MRLVTNSTLSFNDVEIKIRRMFSKLRLPSTGITPQWVDNIRELQHFIEATTPIFGFALVDLVRQETDKLEGSSAGAWTIRDYLIEASTTLRTTEKRLYLMDEGIYETPDNMVATGTWAFNVGKRMTVWDDATKRIFGYPISNPSPTFDAFFDLVHPDYRNEVRHTAMKMFMAVGGEQFQSKYVIRTQDTGEDRLIFQTCRPSRAEGDLWLMGTVTLLSSEDIPAISAESLKQFDSLTTATIQ